MQLPSCHFETMMNANGSHTMLYHSKLFPFKQLYELNSTAHVFMYNYMHYHSLPLHDGRRKLSSYTLDHLHITNNETLSIPADFAFFSLFWMNTPTVGYHAMCVCVYAISSPTTSFIGPTWANMSPVIPSSTVHHPARVSVVNLAKMAETGAPLRHVFPVFMC